MSSDEEVPLNVKVAAHQAKRKRAEPAPPTAPQKSQKPKASGGPLKPPPGYRRMPFVEFVAARQAVLAARRANQPEWTADFVLQNAKFCNIDRRDDAVTAELLAQLEAHPAWRLRERVLLAAALRFTSSRRAEAAVLAELVEAGALDGKEAAGRRRPRGARPERDPLRRRHLPDGAVAAAGGDGRRGDGDRRRRRVAAEGPFADVQEASDVVAANMTVGIRPQFSANETAKDFAYIDGLMQAASHHRCRLGPGAKKGLALVRAERAGGGALGSVDDAVHALRAELRAAAGLGWVETIDVEQALCEYAKYVAYCTTGIARASGTRGRRDGAASGSEHWSFTMLWLDFLVTAGVSSHSCTRSRVRRFHAAACGDCQPENHSPDSRKSLATAVGTGDSQGAQHRQPKIAIMRRGELPPPAARRRAASARFTASAPAAAARHGRARGSRAVAAAAALPSVGGSRMATIGRGGGVDERLQLREAERQQRLRSVDQRAGGPPSTEALVAALQQSKELQQQLQQQLDDERARHGAPSSTGTRRARRRSSLCRRRCRASASCAARCRRRRPPRCPRARQERQNRQRRCTGKSARDAATAAVSCGRRRAATCSCCGAARSGSRPTPSCATGQRTTGLRRDCGRTRQDRRASRRRCAACASASGWPTAASPTAG